MKLGLSCFYPVFLAGDSLQNLLRQGNGRTTGGISFLSMMDFRQSYVIFGMGGHQLRQAFVHLEENIDADTEVAGI